MNNNNNNNNNNINNDHRLLTIATKSIISLRLLTTMYNELTNDLDKMIKHVDVLEKDNKKLKTIVDDMLNYAPYEPGYLETKAHFEALQLQQKNI